MFTAAMVGKKLGFPDTGNSYAISVLTSATQVTVTGNASAEGDNALLSADTGETRKIRLFKRGYRVDSAGLLVKGTTRAPPETGVEERHIFPYGDMSFLDDLEQW